MSQEVVLNGRPHDLGIEPSVKVNTQQDRPFVGLNGRVAGGVSVNGYSYPPAEPGCVLHFPGLPGQGSTIWDRSKEGNDGTIAGATWVRLTSGLWGLYLDGIGDKVVIPNNSAMDFERTTPFTFLFWMKPTGTLSDGTIYCTLNEVVGGIGIRIKYEGVGTIVLRITDNHTVSDISKTCGVYPDAWHRYGFTYDGNGNTNGLSVYRDGALQSTGGGGNLTASTVTGRDHIIGMNIEGARALNAKLDILTIYAREFTAAQIKNGYLLQRHLFGI